MPKDTKLNPVRHVPTSMPTGFKAFDLGETLILDFVTAFPDETMQIFSSVALSRDLAENLAKALNAFIEGENDED